MNQSLSKKWLNEKKTTRSKRHINYYGLWKAGSVEVRPRPLGGLLFVSSTWAKRWSKGCLFESHVNRKWHPKQIVYKDSAQGPYKNLLGSRCETILKFDEKLLKIIGFWWFKTIEKYWKRNNFLDFRSFEKNEKTMPKETSKVMFWGSKMATCAFQVRLILWFLTFWCDAKKWWFLDALPLAPQIRKIGLLLVLEHGRRNERLLLASGVPREAPFSCTRSSGKRYKERRGI